MVPSPQSQGLSEPAGASSDRIASPWRGRARSASPRPDLVSESGVVPQPSTPTSPLSCGSPSKRHYPNARAEKNSSPAVPDTKRSPCPLTPSVVPPWMLPGVPSRTNGTNNVNKSKRLQEMQGSLDLSMTKKLSTNDKMQAQRSFNIFKVPNMDTTSRKGRVGLHSRSLPPEVFGAAPESPTPTAKSPCPRATLQSPEIPCCSMPIQPVVQRPAEKITMARLTGPDLRALAEMEEVSVIEQSLPRRSVKEILSASFKPPMRKEDFSRKPLTSSPTTGSTAMTQSHLSLISDASTT